jgi:isoleucyl-tRNA synthetase
VEVILADVTGQHATGDAAWLESHADLVCDELNVKAFEICREPERYITRSVQADLKKLGPRLGKDLPKARDAIAKADASKLLAAVARDGRATVEWAGGGSTVEPGELLVRTTAKPGWAAAEGPAAVVVVAKDLTPELVAEGLAREVVHVVQSMRKSLELEFTDRIDLGLGTPSAALRRALEPRLDGIASETLAARVGFEPVADGASESHDIDGHPLTITIARRS